VEYNVVLIRTIQPTPGLDKPAELELLELKSV